MNDEKITTKETIEAFAAANDITIEAVFVPWSRSRSFKAGKPVSERNLNWRVTLKKGARTLLETDYSAGCGHCPSYKQNARWTIDYTKVIEMECETGFAHNGASWGPLVDRKRPIKPDVASVLHSLCSDADVLNHSRFEDWASELGYDADSRSAEKTYRACLDIALALRNGLGEKLFADLQEEVSGY